VSASPGLTNLLTDDPTTAELEQFRTAPRLLVIPSGPIPPNPAELLGSGRMTALLQHLSTLADNSLVIIDSSPVLAVADPVVLATKVDGCIMVIDSTRTRVPVVRRALDALRRVHAPLLGAVINKVLDRESAYYRYEGYYGTHPQPVRAAGGARAKRQSQDTVTADSPEPKAT